MNNHFGFALAAITVTVLGGAFVLDRMTSSDEPAPVKTAAATTTPAPEATPVAANGKLYLSSEEGDVIVVRMGEKFEILATNTLRDQSFIATPAIIDGEIYLRSESTLFNIR